MVPADAMLTWRAVADELRAGRVEGAARRVERWTIFDETGPLHDAGRDRAAAMMSWVARRGDADELFNAYRHAVGPWYMSSVRASGEGGATSGIAIDAEFIRAFVALGAVRGFEIADIEEDDDSVTFRVRMSGEKLLQEGYYDPAGHARFVHVDGPHPMTFMRDRYDVYNVHEAVGNLLMVEAGLAPPSAKSLPDDAGFIRQRYSKCQCAVPAEEWATLGIEDGRQPCREPGRHRTHLDAAARQRLLRPTESVVGELLAVGDVADALVLLEGLEARWLRICDIYRQWPALVGEWVLGRWGVDAVEELHADADRIVREGLRVRAGG